MRYPHIVIGVFLWFAVSGCTKGFLEKSPSSDIIVPNTLEHLAGLLNNNNLFGQTPVYGEQSAGDYYIPDSLYNQLSALDKNLYTWEKDIYSGQGNIADWNIPYQQVYTANVVLDELPGILPTTATQAQWNQIKGTALFMRAWAFHQLALEFAPYYDPRSADQQPGVVLPLNTNLQVVYARSTLRQTYTQIIADLLLAKDLLPVHLADPQFSMPNKASVCGMLARVYLSMADYEQARRYADSTLGYYPTLINYNVLDVTERSPFATAKNEVLYASSLIAGNVLLAGWPYCIIDSLLYRLYNDNDLRKGVYFRISSLNLPLFKGSYTGGVLSFSGLATDEIYLIRAECYARQGYIALCLADINTLLVNRYKTGTYVPPLAATAEEALNLVLTERRKELVFRGLRWSDLKRLNGQGAGLSLTRKVGNKLYMLLPNSNRWLLPIPDDALAESHIEQNPR